jgi:RimJ/RimL family protein N-acetyltransferase
MEARLLSSHGDHNLRGFHGPNRGSPLHWSLLSVVKTGAFLGIVGFAAPAGWPGFELAWTLARRWWGYGYATEGAQAALAHAFDVWRQDRVISLIHPENQASIRVAERIGERLQGRIQHLGEERLCYGIDRESHLLTQRQDRQETLLAS